MYVLNLLKIELYLKIMVITIYINGHKKANWNTCIIKNR